MLARPLLLGLLVAGWSQPSWAGCEGKQVSFRVTGMRKAASGAT